MKKASAFFRGGGVKNLPNFRWMGVKKCQQRGLGRKIMKMCQRLKWILCKSRKAIIFRKSKMI